MILETIQINKFAIQTYEVLRIYLITLKVLCRAGLFLIYVIMEIILFWINWNIFIIAFIFYKCKKTESDIKKYIEDKTNEYLSEIKNRHN